MSYQEAADILAAYLEANWPKLDGPWASVLDKAYSALVDCAEMGLTGEDDGPS